VRADDASPQNFRLTLRPETYGVGLVRSYYTDESLIIRGTGEDRPATASDPPALDCEWSEGESCALDMWAAQPVKRPAGGR
jgi:hypothetical protein